MPYSVIVLRQGYCRELNTGGSDVACTITLLKGQHTILVDTGSAFDSQFLVDALSRNGVSPDGIDYVIGTHGHSDHIGNLNLFTKATHIVSHDVNIGNTYYQHDFNQGVPYAIDEDVTVVSTPGHTSQDISVYVQSDSGQLGLVAVCGDLFENENDVEDPDVWQAQSQFPEIQQKSRMKMMKRADTIIPGHGKMFKPSQSFKDDPHMIMVMSTSEDGLQCGTAIVSEED